ncbi:MarR family winged helix-turn-helix transcriptional regulator [Pseudomonas sp. NA-150]|uniref:MarR family winged helix-turn-helix transcriptional regulator n=1 Tax=Pseudomonas sp. NA-150 TaxID=3367525 RepID=UPI0037CB837B
MFTDCYCTQFRRAANSLTSIYDRALKPVGLKITQFSMLRALERLGSATFTEMAKEAALDKTTISRSLKLLIDAGWVSISNEQDARFKVASLSPEGTKMLRQAEDYWRLAQRQVEKEFQSFLVGPVDTGLLKALETIQHAGSEAIGEDCGA